MNKILSNQYVRGGLFVAAGLFLGWLFFHAPEKHEETHNHSAEEAKKEVWTCSMHPQIRMIFLFGGIALASSYFLQKKHPEN